MKTRIFALFFFIALVAANASGGLLDGTAWKVQVVPTTKTADKDVPRFEDVLTFARGRLLSRELKHRGIGAVTYQAKGTPDFYNWETVPIVRGRPVAQWDGVIKDQDIKGNLKWVTKDGRVLYFFINGKKVLGEAGER